MSAPHLPTARLLVAMARYRPWVYGMMSVILIFLPYLFNLVPGLVARSVFDQLSGQAVAGLNITSMLTLLLAAALAVHSLGMVGFWLEGVIIARVETLLRNNMLTEIFAQPGARALPTTPGEAISRFRDDPRAILQFLTYAPDVPAQAAVLVISLIILAQIDLLFTLAVFVPLLLTIVTVNLATRRIRRYRLSNQQAIGAVTDVLSSIFGAVQSIKVTGAEPHVLRYFDTINERRRRAALRDLLLTQTLTSFANNAANVAIGVLLLLAAQTFQQRGTPLTVGDLALFVSYLTALAGLIGFFGEIMTRYRQTEVSVQRLHEMMPAAPPEALVDAAADSPVRSVPIAAPSASEPLETLEVRNLSYHYPQTTNGIHDVSFTLTRGTLTVVTGRVGSGKTTLLRAVLGLLPAQAGTMHWNGQPIHDPAAFFVPPHSAYTPQVPRLFSETLRNSVLQGWPADEAALDAALRQVVFEDDLARLEAGLETVVGPRGAKLSGGQAQRVAAARMLVRRAALIVCDDLSSALDLTTERMLWDRVLAGERDAHQAPTVLAVSHRRPVLQRASQIIVLRDGRVDAVGSVAELLATNQEFQHLWTGTRDA